jgi:hypothetical protein
MLVNVLTPSLGLKRLCVTRQLLTTLSISRPLLTQLDAKQTFVHKDYKFTIRYNNYLKKQHAKVTVLFLSHNYACNALFAKARTSQID